eukprot:739771-Amphidinium_carterae.1
MGVQQNDFKKLQSFSKITYGVQVIKTGILHPLLGMSSQLVMQLAWLLEKLSALRRRAVNDIQGQTHDAGVYQGLIRFAWACVLEMVTKSMDLNGVERCTRFLWSLISSMFQQVLKLGQGSRWVKA